MKHVAGLTNFSELLASGISPNCVSDMEVFAISLAKFLGTLALCAAEGGCTAKQEKILNDNMFAVKQVDSFGKLPAGIMEMTLVSTGSYTECKELIAPYQTHYCYADITLNNATDVMALLGAKVAVCMPSTCGEKDIPLLMEKILKNNILPLRFPYASCVPTKVEPTKAFWIYASFLAFFILWAVLASAVDYVVDTEPRLENLKTSVVMRIFLSFSFYTNASVLLNTNPPKEGSLRSLASIRFVSMTWVVAGHALGTEVMSSENLAPVLKLWNPLLATTFTNAFLSVDTFFLLSGILVAYLFFKSRPNAKFVRSPATWTLFYVHRYLRLTPPIMMFIGLSTVLLPFTDGPWLAAGQPNALKTSIENCQKYWWRNLLYINNLFGNSNECYAITWYLAVDTQLYLVAPIFLIALYISPLIGAVLLMVCCAGSVAYTYAITLRDDLPPIVMGAFAITKFSTFFDEFYEKPWCRCPPYLIGIGVGYLLAKMDRKPKPPRIAMMTGWITAVAIALLCLYGPHNYIKGDANWSQLVRATYNNFSRIGWSLAVSWVIVANFLGWGGPIAAFMEHPLWQPLGRISYCGYIVHFYLITYIFNLDDRSAHYVSIWHTYVYRVIPITVLSYMTAFFWSCLFEVPTAKLEKMLIEALFLKKKEKILPLESAKTIPTACETNNTTEKLDLRS